MCRLASARDLWRSWPLVLLWEPSQPASGHHCELWNSEYWRYLHQWYLRHSGCDDGYADGLCIYPGYGYLWTHYGQRWWYYRNGWTRGSGARYHGRVGWCWQYDKSIDKRLCRRFRCSRS